MEDPIAHIMQTFPGFTFHPTDEQLLLDYLKPKIEGSQDEQYCVIPEVEACQYDPWHLPRLFNELSIWKPQSVSREWIFFCPRKRKYSNSQRSDRTTPSGYWKVTGAERRIKAKNGAVIGFKKTLVFHKGRVPKGERTHWVLHEYHLKASCLGDESRGDQLPYVACRLKLKKDKKGVTTPDYPTEDSSHSSPYTSDLADYTQVSEGDSRTCNTPNSTTSEYHEATADQYAPAFEPEFQISLDDPISPFPSQLLEDEATPGYTMYNSGCVFDYGHGYGYGYEPPPPLSPMSTWDFMYNSQN